MTEILTVEPGEAFEVPDLETELLATATRCGPALAENAARYDRSGEWAAESFEHVRSAGLLAIAVPVELGGRGASIATVARSSASSAAGAARLRSPRRCTSTSPRSSPGGTGGLPGAEAALRRVATDRIVLASAGGGDFTEPAGLAVRVDGGMWRSRSSAPSTSVSPTVSMRLRWRRRRNGAPTRSSCDASG